MKNQTLINKAREELAFFPELRAKVLKAIASRGASTTTHDALEGLLDLLKVAKKPARPCTRRLREDWAYALVSLAYVQASNGFKPVQRAKFTLLRANDVSVLQHWGFMQPAGPRGSWTITRAGIKWLLGKTLVNEAIRFNGHSADVPWSFDYDGKLVGFADVNGSALDMDLRRRLLCGLTNVPQRPAKCGLKRNHDNDWKLPQWVEV